jgi:hypothetical protein
LEGVEKMSMRRAEPVENLCAKINFGAECAGFAGEQRHGLSFVIHFACSRATNA